MFSSTTTSARYHTIACAYSVRGVPEAPVSTPISWPELVQVDPRQFTIAPGPPATPNSAPFIWRLDDSSSSLDALPQWADRGRPTRIAA